jgi:TonB-dependent SusC/RagA subfamily outer membrane receptor
MTKLNKSNQKNEAGNHTPNWLFDNLQFWRVMKLTNVFLFLCLLNVSATGYTQLVSIRKSNVGLEEIFKEIYKQTGFSYSSRSKDINEAKNISIEANKVPISTALDIAPKNQPLTYTLGDKIIIIQSTERRTINSSTFPLIALDESTFTGNLDNINLNDVESITILKDDANTCIYRMGRANGVIVITTKKGLLDQKFRIEDGPVLNIAEKRDINTKPMMSLSIYMDG